jgi:hypothetical protein
MPSRASALLQWIALSAEIHVIHKPIAARLPAKAVAHPGPAPADTPHDKTRANSGLPQTRNQRHPQTCRSALAREDNRAFNTGLG